MKEEANNTEPLDPPHMPESSKPPVAEPKPKSKPNLESTVRARIEKEIESKKSNTSITKAIDPTQTATIEASMREELNKEVARRQADKEKADKEKSKKEKGDKKSDKDGDEKSKSGDEKSKSGDDKPKKKAGTGKKAGARRKKPGSQTRPQLSEREQRIMEEKVLIDTKLRKRNKYIYAAITILFLIGLVVIAKLGDRSQQPPAPAPKINLTTPPPIGDGSSATPGTHQSRTFKAANKEAYGMISNQDYQGAVDYLTHHAETFSGDASACEKAIKMINDNYINPIDLPPPDPKARWTKAQKRAAAEKAKLRRNARESQFGDGGDPVEGAASKAAKVVNDALDDLEIMEEDLIDDPPAPPGGAAEGDAGDDPFAFDDTGLKDEPKEEEKEEADPFDDL